MKRYWWMFAIAAIAFYVWWESDNEWLVRTYKRELGRDPRGPYGHLNGVGWADPGAWDAWVVTPKAQGKTRAQVEKDIAGTPEGLRWRAAHPY